MRRRALTTLALLVAAAVAAGCGSDDDKGAPIPADAAAALENQLTGIQGRLDVPGACNDITGGDDPNTDVVNQIIRDLPNDVDEDAVQGLRDGFDRLFALVEERCAEEREQTDTETDTVETEPEETTPTETVETETDTTPTETTEEPTDELPPGQDGELPPGQDDQGPGQGNGGGAIVPGGEG